MTSTARKGRGARQFVSGTLVPFSICACATVALLAYALRQPAFRPAPVAYDLAHDTELARIVAPAGNEPDISARAHLELFTISGDTRHLRYAKARLAGAEAGNPLLASGHILKARILQAEHRFDAATAILQDVLRSDPGHAEAWLLLSDSLRRAGRISEARAACLKLALRIDAQLAEWCAIQVLLSAGDAETALTRARDGLLAADAMQDSARLWAFAIAAEAAASAGRLQDAQVLFEEIMATGMASFASRLAFADVLIELGDSRAVTEVLRDDHDKVAALIRLVVASKAGGESVDAEMLARITASFAGMSAEETADLRLRDRAYFELYFNRDFDAALQYARSNWAQQQGPEDLRLIREAAVRANKPELIPDGWQS